MLLNPRLLSILAFSCLGAVQAISQETNWSKSSFSASELAAKVDWVLHHLKSTKMDYIYGFKINTGHGLFTGSSEVKNQQTYRIEYPLIGKTEEEGLRRQSIVQQGGKVMIATQDAQGRGFKVTSSASPRIPSIPSDIVEGWYRNNVSYLLGAIGSNSKPLEALIKGASANPELIVRAESRITPQKKQSIREYRIVVYRKEALAKKKGGLFYEIVIGDKYFFPLTMMNRRSEGKMGYLTSMYGTRWNPSPTQSFDPKAFDPKVYHIQTRTVQ